jgi:hypothetical protein
MRTKFRSVRLKERDHSEDLRVDGKMILKLMLGKKGLEGVCWIRLA